MPIDHHHPPAIGRIDRGTYGGQFVSGQRTEIVPPSAGLGGRQKLFNFQMFDASDALSGAQVLILDGKVLGPTFGAIFPDGMPSNDTYQLPVDNNDEIWIQVTWDLETDDSVSGDNITAVSLNHGSITPDDTFNGGINQYFTIGKVAVNFSTTVPTVTPRNFFCGDLSIWLPPNKETGVTNDLALVVDKDTHNRVWKKVCDS
jgi:hypothetical protein